MKFIITSLLLLQSYIYACTLCATNVPNVVVNTNIIYKEDKTQFKVTWDFHKEFVDTLSQYDQNKNKKFDANEKVLIEDALVSYLKETRYLIDIEYIHKNKPFQLEYIEDINPTKTSLDIDTDGMRYSFDFDAPFVLKDDYKLYVSYYDGGGNFDFTIKDIVLKDYPNYKEIEPKLMYTYIHFYETAKHDMKKDYEDDRPRVLLVKQPNQDKQNIEEVDEQNQFTKALGEKLTELKDELQLILKDIKENNSISSYFWLLLFSFLYGVVHAIGPGHGKSLVASYFVSQEKSYLKAFSISSMIGIVHTFSAFLLTLIVYYSLGFIFNSALVDMEQVATKVSAVIIILIALYMIYNKIKKTRNNINFSVAKNPSNIRTSQQIHQNNLSCECNACKTTSTDIGVILAAGIVPCPGTVTIFIFTMSLGIYYVGFLSAIFMSVGMSLVIFITALISVRLRKSSSSNTTLVKLLEYGSLLFILSLGIILLII